MDCPLQRHLLNAIPANRYNSYDFRKFPGDHNSAELCVVHGAGLLHALNASIYRAIHYFANALEYKHNDAQFHVSDRSQYHACRDEYIGEREDHFMSHEEDLGGKSKGTQIPFQLNIG
ncbi:hypothetical protein KIN20_002791 [Parelaphostrongylus tenuis]|uniref:Uncharacterized protein n=1 Tax=Parelaphostrongylus tenuis TaxID=148309 RepID=A0AAD5QDR6_PARTN|nr:hypothetical protein KIN20_002791 [Parelaphostrongylus tenuis]